MAYRKWGAAALAVAVEMNVPAGAQVLPSSATVPTVATAPVSAPVEDAMPVAPALVAASFATPAQDEGGYMTPNRDLGAEEATWHVRVALNVAALGCRGPEEGAVTAAYNALLTAHRTGLAAAMAGTERAYRERAGAAWQARYDDDMTRLYNFWAQTHAHAAFCETAAAVLRETADVPAEALPAFARTALARLEAPFTRFYAAYDDYRTALAGWTARHAPMQVAAPLAASPTVIAAVAALPVAPAAAAPITIAAR